MASNFPRSVSLPSHHNWALAIHLQRQLHIAAAAACVTITA
jgi:hypothetical protein